MLLQAGVEREREAALELLPAPEVPAIRPAVPTLLSACTRISVSPSSSASSIARTPQSAAADRSLESIRSCDMLL